MRQSLRRVRTDIQRGRHLEAYTIFALGMVLTPLGVLGVVSEQLLLSAVLPALSYLVFRTAVPSGGRSLDDVLEGRERLAPFPQLLTDVRTLWLYGPTCVNVTRYAADIRRQVMDRGGEVRVIVQDPDTKARDYVRAQLDDNQDFDHTLATSLGTLQRMRSWGNATYRMLPFSPGFSMVIVNANQRNGFIILELHGFKDENISDRMHIRISRSESLHWFDYWIGRFTAMWDSAREPNDRVSAPDAT